MKDFFRKFAFVVGMGMLCFLLSAALAMGFSLAKKHTNTRFAEMSDADEETEKKSKEGVTEKENWKDATENVWNTELETEKSSEDSEDERSSDEDSEKTIRMVFAGDVMLSEYPLRQYEAKGIDGVLSEGLKNSMLEADLCIINEEFPFSTRGVQAEDKQYTFEIDPRYVSVFQDMGVDLVTLANNHSLDYGRDALEDSFDTLSAAGIRYMGAGNNRKEAMTLQVFEIKGKRLGFLAATRVWPQADWTVGESNSGLLGAYDLTNLKEAIQNAKDQCDFLTVYLHWGVERNTYPEEYERAIAKTLQAEGVDLLIGSHPHVLQGCEYVEEMPVFYSLGNYIFGSSIPSTMLLQVELGEDNQLQCQMLPAVSSNGYTEKLTSETARIAAYETMSQLSYGVEVNAQGIFEKK